ncbi:MAG: BatA and WFA domain-containing protein [Planctomycetota bacterium]|nr:BatA and WFA domain-containing protein [Planctomycetota bacterium]
MEFLTGTMLWGLLAGALPVAIHLTGRAKPVVHRFPALRFILRSQRASSRALRIKHLLLLLLRIAALALLAFALARPLWPWPSAAGMPGATVRGEYVLVLDGSLSMAYREHERARFDEAREQALAFLERLAPESRVALILATEEAANLQGRLTLNHPQVRELLQGARPTGRGLDAGRALQAADGIFAREPETGLPRATIFFTDLQRYAMEKLAQRAPGLEGGAATAPLLVVDVGSEDARNGAVLSARIPGPTAAAEEPLTVTGTLRPVDPARALPVDLFLDGVKVAQQQVDPKGAAEVAYEFRVPAGKPGPHACEVKLAQGDGLMEDQARAACYVAGRPPRALLVEQGARDSKEKDSGFFLRAALASPAAASASGLAVTPVKVEALDVEGLAQYQAVILADPGPLPERAWEALQRFVAEGGGLFVWLGPRADLLQARRHAYSEFAAHRGLLPGRIVEFQRLEPPLALRVAAPNHPLLARFTAGVLSVLRNVTAGARVKVVPEALDTLATVVLELEDGSPLVLEKSYGRGRVVLCAIGPEPDSSALPKNGEVFVTLTLEATRLLSGRGEEAEARLGRPHWLDLDAPPPDGKVLWRRPGDAPAEVLSIDVGERDEAGGAKPRARLMLPSLDAPGIHRVSWRPPNAKEDRVLLLAVNPDPDESDLARMEESAALAALKPWKAERVRRLDEARLKGVERPAGRELPVALLGLVLLVLFAESFLSNRLYRGGDEEAANTPS